MWSLNRGGPSGRFARIRKMNWVLFGHHERAINAMLTGGINTRVRASIGGNVYTMYNLKRCD